MIDLSKISGLPIALTDDFHLKFDAPLNQRDPSIIRKFSEMVPVLMEPETKIDREEMYYVYRGLCLPEHQELIAKKHLTYDVTIIPPAMIGREFAKTVGHYHDVIPGTQIAHPELYEILYGQALILWQKMDLEFKKVIAVHILEARAGDKIVYPPNYGHILVNIGTEPLVTANWLSTDYKPLYEPVAQKRGMAYYAVVANDGGYEMVANPAYAELPPVRTITTKFMDGFPIIIEARPMYTEGTFHPDRLEFLGNPQKYAVQLSSITS